MRNTITGFYGKIPSHGDFIHSNLPRTFIDSWDPWLQSIIAHWRNELEGDWVADYLTMTPYRFILSKGIAGEVNWLGVLLPSRDRVGRLFPLTICTPLPSKISPLKIQQFQSAWLDELEEIALSCLHPNFNPELIHTSFAEDLNKLGLPDISMVKGGEHISPDNLLHEISCSYPDTSPQHRQFSFALKQTEEAHLPLAETLLNEYCHAYSLWWSKNDQTVLYSQGLPHKSISPALIDKKWQEWGWLANAKKTNNATKVVDEDDTQAFR